MFSEFPDVGEGLTPYLVDLPSSNELCQKKLANIAKLNMETATAFLYVMTYNELKNEQDFEAIKAIYNKDRRKSFTQAMHWQYILISHTFISFIGK